METEPRLIYDFRILNVVSARFVMPFVDENGTIRLNPIFIWGIGSERHQNHRMCTAHVEIHPTLKAQPFAPTHFYVRDDLVSHSICEQIGL
jgi:hypothetical protein